MPFVSLGLRNSPQCCKKAAHPRPRKTAQSEGEREQEVEEESNDDYFLSEDPKHVDQNQHCLCINRSTEIFVLHVMVPQCVVYFIRTHPHTHTHTYSHNNDPSVILHTLHCCSEFLLAANHKTGSVDHYKSIVTKTCV